LFDFESQIQNLENCITMTIFGFNTDVKLEDSTYHVQSEARQADLLLQTMVFVKGQCVGKRTTSYAHRTAQTDFSEEATHELLKLQHKTMVDTIQQGDVATALQMTGDVEDVEGDGLALGWIGSPAFQDGSLTVRLFVSDKGVPVPSAKIWIMHSTSSDNPMIMTTATSADGHADLNVPINSEIEAEQAVMVRAKYGPRSVTRKLRFKK
jgi:hypothetical protein